MSRASRIRKRAGKILPIFGEDDPTWAQLYALYFGVGLTVTGIVGLFVDADFSVGGHLESHSLGLFGVNGWHNLFHLAFGLLGLASFASPRRASGFALAWGSLAGVLLAWGVLSSYPVFGLIPADDGDNFLHIFDFSLGIGAWWASRRYEPQPATTKVLGSER